MEESLFALNDQGGIELWEVIEAYYDCRRHKRRTANAIRFEMNWEQECVSLWHDINDGSYRPGRSIAFIVEKPKKREVFAADFRDRVVHHLIARKITPLLEQEFILDSYSTRENKGTTFGIRRVANMIHQATRRYRDDAWVMKADIEGFFMSINKQMLYRETEQMLKAHYRGNDLKLLLWLIGLTVMNRPEKNCVRKSPPKAWQGLPPTKSLFGTDGSCGLPIGNLTSQLLALLHLNLLDHLVEETWTMMCGYGRYVDDMVLVDTDKDKLMAVHRNIGIWLRDHGHRLHPKKFYLQPATNGVLFVGGMIRPGRMLVGNRTKTFALQTVYRYNQLAAKKDVSTLDKDEVMGFVSSMNSYLGLMQQFSAQRLAQKLIAAVAPAWWQRAQAVQKRNGGWKLTMTKEQADENGRQPTQQNLQNT